MGQIISVNAKNLENMPFDKAVEHFAQLSLPITVQFRPPLYPPKKQPPQRHSHHHDHDHHHHDCEDDEAEGTCYIACYTILFVIGFMFSVSVFLNGFPTSLPSFSSMPRLFPQRGSRKGRRGKNKRDNNIKEKLKQNSERAEPPDNSRKILKDVMSDMNNIQNLLHDVDMNLDDIQMDDLFQDKEEKKQN